MACEWRTSPTGKFVTWCGELVEWKIPDLDRYKFCPFCGKELKIIPE